MTKESGVTMPAWTDEDRKLFKELMANKCRCGTWKATAKSHCLECYRKLPQHVQRALYRRISDGYAEAFRESIKFLDDYAARFKTKVCSE